MAGDSDTLRMTASTVDKSTTVWKAIAKEIKQVADAGRLAESAISGFAGGLASGMFQQLTADIGKLGDAIKNLGARAIEMKYLAEETLLTQQQVLRFRYAAEQLGISSDAADAMLRGLTGKIRDMSTFTSDAYRE